MEEYTPTGTREQQEHDIGFFLSNISHSVQQYFNRLYDEYGITYPQSRLLTHMYKAEQSEDAPPPNINQRELERALGIKASSVSSLVRNLERKGFITSQRVESDTRNKRILLTPKAIELDTVIAKAVDETERSMVEGMSEADVQELLRLLAILRDNARRLSESQA